MGKKIYKKMLVNYTFFKNPDIFRFFSHSKMLIFPIKKLIKTAKSLLITFISYPMNVFR